MESDQGWSIPLERFKDGKRVFYRYSTRSFSIKNQSINESDVNQLKETLSTLTRFKGMPQFEWMEELLIRMESTFTLKGANKVSVGFEQNPYLKGLNFFTELFNAIQYKKVLEVKYKGFKQQNPIDLTFHPYFLKQYNSRWFIFGFNSEENKISNLALDRIIEISDTSSEFIENQKINFEEYFEDVVGVTIKVDQGPVKITLEINKRLWPYIETKPIHGSQKIKSKTENSVIIELYLQMNYELSSVIFSLGEDINVIEPVELRETIKSKAEGVLKNYL